MSEAIKNMEKSTAEGCKENAPKGTEDGKTFTQDEVNEIVKNRLERERRKASSENIENDREKDLQERESKLWAWEMKRKAIERIEKVGLDPDAIDLMDLSSDDAFEASLAKLQAYLKKTEKKEEKQRGVIIENRLPPQDYGGTSSYLSEAFKPPKSLLK